MEKRMIRCVSIKPDKKTGEHAVKFLSESVVNNRFFMKKYGWKVEEVKEEVRKVKTLEEAFGTVATNYEKMIDSEIAKQVAEEFTEVPEPVFIEGAESTITYTAVETPKAPVKPKATRAKRKTTKQ